MKTYTVIDVCVPCVLDTPCFAILLHEETDLVQESKVQALSLKGETLISQGEFASSVL